MLVQSCLPVARAASRLAVLMLPATALAQDPGPSVEARRMPILAPVTTVGGPVDEWIRTRQLTDSTRPAADFLLRAPSTMTPPLSGGSHTFRWAVVLPEVSYVSNRELPYSFNDGAIWAGRGINARVLTGLRAEWGAVRAILAPELLYSANKPYPLTDNRAVRPPFPAGRSQWANPWHVGPYPFSIDLPLRFGDEPLHRIDPGQSSITVRAWNADFGVATENEWWGPAVRNALVLSSNAPGFEHAFLRTGRPVETRIGAFSARWLVGTLQESDFFDDDDSNDLRSISMLGLTWQPAFERDITVGVARAVFAPTGSHGEALGDFAQVFRDVGQPNGEQAFSPANSGRDQILSVFLRWVFPGDRLEAYAEWGRAQQPVTLRDFLVEPNHTQAYTVGLQWLGPEIRIGGRYPLPGGRTIGLSPGRVRVRTEFTSLEQSTTFRLRTTGTWYTSSPVLQGYTHRGQSLGAAIGPGSSSQWLAMDYAARMWYAGVSLERIRWQEDAHSLLRWPAGAGGWCEHDVSFLPAVNGSWITRYGTFAAAYTMGWRLNAFFKYSGAACPAGLGGDVRTNRLSLTFSPAIRP
jgi:hypothetical protein